MFSFTMSGQRFDFDEDAEVTAADIFAFEEATGIPIDGSLELLAEQMLAGEVTSRGLRAVVGLAWLAHRRAGGGLGWDAFCGTVAPATLQVVDDPAPERPPARTASKAQKPARKKLPR